MKMKSFKVLYIMTDPFGMGGVQSDIKALGPYFVEKGHEVVLACPEGDQVEYLTKRGVIHIPFSVHFRNLSQFREQASRLRDLIKEVNPTILAPQSIRASWICHAAARHLPIARVTTIHNIHSPINALWSGIILNKASHLVIFESEHEHRRIVRMGLSGKKARVIPSGIDTEAFYPDKEKGLALRKMIGLDENNLVFGCVARLSEEKAHKDLLKAFSIVRKNHSFARLVLVGDGPLRNEIETQAKSLGVADAVYFAGQRSNVRDYLNLFDIFVLASTRESLPRAAREAMACGLPIIATRVGATREAVQDGFNGFLAPPGNPDQFAREMLHFLLEPELIKVMGERSLAMIEERFSQKRWLLENEKVYLKAGSLANRVLLTEIGSLMTDPDTEPSVMSCS